MSFSPGFRLKVLESRCFSLCLLLSGRSLRGFWSSCEEREKEMNSSEEASWNLSSWLWETIKSQSQGCPNVPWYSRATSSLGWEASASVGSVVTSVQFPVWWKFPEEKKCAKKLLNTQFSLYFLIFRPELFVFFTYFFKTLGTSFVSGVTVGNLLAPTLEATDRVVKLVTARRRKEARRAYRQKRCQHRCLQASTWDLLNRDEATWGGGCTPAHGRVSFMPVSAGRRVSWTSQLFFSVGRLMRAPATQQEPLTQMDV